MTGPTEIWREAKAVTDPKTAQFGVVSAALGVCLLGILFPIFGITFRDFARILHQTPLWVFVVLAVTNGATILAGSIKWILALRSISKSANDVPLLSAMMATSIGVLLGQAMPIQIATAASRAVVGKRQHVSPTSSIVATAYEQYLEFAIVLALAIASIAALLFRWPLPLFVAIALLLILFLVLSAGATIALAYRLASLLAGIVPRKLGNPARLLEEALDGSRSVRPALVAELTALTLMRYALMVGGAIIMAKALISNSDPLQVALIFPVVQLAIALPITPAGLGIAEITWTGLFVSSGIPPKEAAMAAAAMRLVNLLGFLIFFALFLAIATRLSRTSPKPKNGRSDTFNATSKGE